MRRRDTPRWGRTRDFTIPASGPLRWFREDDSLRACTPGMEPNPPHPVLPRPRGGFLEGPRPACQPRRARRAPSSYWRGRPRKRARPGSPSRPAATTTKRRGPRGRGRAPSSRRLALGRPDEVDAQTTPFPARMRNRHNTAPIIEHVQKHTILSVSPDGGQRRQPICEPLQRFPCIFRAPLPHHYRRTQRMVGTTKPSAVTRKRTEENLRLCQPFGRGRFRGRGRGRATAARRHRRQNHRHESQSCHARTLTFRPRARRQRSPRADRHDAQTATVPARTRQY